MHKILINKRFKVDTLIEEINEIERKLLAFPIYFVLVHLCIHFFNKNNIQIFILKEFVCTH